MADDPTRFSLDDPSPSNPLALRAEREMKRQDAVERRALAQRIVELLEGYDVRTLALADAVTAESVALSGLRDGLTGTNAGLASMMAMLTAANATSTAAPKTGAVTATAFTALPDIPCRGLYLLNHNLTGLAAAFRGAGETGAGVALPVLTASPFLTVGNAKLIQVRAAVLGQPIHFIALP